MSATLTAPDCATRLRIRGYEPGDETAVCELFSRHTPYRRDFAFWHWLNREVPTQPSVVAVAELDGEIVGHYGILPVELRLPDGATVLAGHGVHAFVSPDCRGEAGIFQISAKAYQLAAQAGVQFVYGFPNPNYRLVQEKIERWRCVSLFKAWTKPAAAPDRPRASLVRFDAGDETQRAAAIRLWEACDRTGAGIRVADTARWWLRRYLWHPHAPYEIHWLRAAGTRVGLVVTKLFRSESGTRAHLIDCVLAGASAEELLAAFEAEFAARAETFAHWPMDAEFAAALAAGGYREDGFETYLGVRALAGGELPAGVLTAANWRRPMGLSDAF